MGKTEEKIDGLGPLFGEEVSKDKPVIIAGPCSAESYEQTLCTARGLQECGIRVFRAGLWKPRTKPGSFEGVGARGLRWVREACSVCGMIPATEIASPSHLHQALRSGIHDFWIGARTTANPFAVQSLADALATLGSRELDRMTLLVKNPVNPDLELWIGALQRIHRSGVRRLGAIHRGFSAYGERYYRNRPEWSIPIELKRRVPGLPVICDPSHIGGRRDLILTLSQEALDMDFDGLIIESHCDPDGALSDSSQQVTPAELGRILGSLVRRSGAERTGVLDVYRDEIDRIDDEIVALLGRRMEVAGRIGELKQRAGMPVVQPARYNALMARRAEEGERVGLRPEFLRKVFGAVHEESVRLQVGIDKDNLNN